MKKFFMTLCFVTLIIFPAFGAVDIDLSAQNNLMAYSALFNILTNPDAFLGKTVKISGLFDSAKDPDTGIDYFAVVITDPGACCAAGLDFSPKKEYKYEYPKDYPAIGSNITVIGKFSRYTEGRDTFYHLAEADMIKGK